jgi:hypothetical protein
MRTPTVKAWTIKDQPLRFDAFVAPLGYETRARFAAETLDLTATLRLACAFPDHRESHEYQNNRRRFERAGFAIDTVTDAEFANWFRRTFIEALPSNSTTATIGIDVSSFSRFRIASMVDVIGRDEKNRALSITFLYSLAEYSPPPTDFVPNVHVGPMLPSFAGWSKSPENPPVAVVGLGYEQDKALGAVEHIQATEVWTFAPHSNVGKYPEATQQANRILFDAVPQWRRLSYELEDPFDCFVQLESLICGILPEATPVIFPFGPKIFAVPSLLVACLHSDCALWRVSQGGEHVPQNRIPTGQICGLEAIFEPQNTATTSQALQNSKPQAAPQ